MQNIWTGHCFYNKLYINQQYTHFQCHISKYQTVHLSAKDIVLHLFSEKKFIISAPKRRGVSITKCTFKIQMEFGKKCFHWITIMNDFKWDISHFHFILLIIIRIIECNLPEFSHFDYHLQNFAKKLLKSSTMEHESLPTKVSKINLAVIQLITKPVTPLPKPARACVRAPPALSLCKMQEDTPPCCRASSSVYHLISYTLT